ncbi:GlxA family transcriptional regulator [Pseudoduganella sp. LjRoot289]|uniref:GlxA family transcriptional regulator n=1 Tax=Pseudoduganella sp. LjRoot289 TaxID=3342314 RepID=UPI003F505C69
MRKPLLLFAAFPGMSMLDMSGPQTVFHCAGRRMEERGMQGYQAHTVSVRGGLMPTMEGVAIQTESLAGFALADIDTIIVPGTLNIEQAVAQSEELLAWLRLAAGQARRIASVCSGAFMLARAGLLDGRRAATHWAMCERLQALHPLVEVDSDAIFVQQDKVWTSAGVTSGIDLALALVEADCGRAIALDVARELVVFLKRPGGQAQFSTLLQAQSKDGAAFDELHLWINDNLVSGELTVETLAARASMSPRNFTRVYKEKTGRTPAKAVEVFRLEAARRMLEESDRHIDQVARLCGYGDEGRMRQSFQRNLSLSPSVYRERFRSASSFS